MVTILTFVVLIASLMATGHANPFVRTPTNLSWACFLLVDFVGYVALKSREEEKPKLANQ